VIVDLGGHQNGPVPLRHLLATDQPTAENAEKDNERKGGGENPANTLYHSLF
jgi:hypothetical protein